MPSINNDSNDNVKYIRNLAKRAFRSIAVDEEDSVEKIKKEFGEKKKLINKSNLGGLAFGLAIGIILCIAASLIGVSFTNLESAFIIGQFAILGALMSYIYS